MWESDSIKYVEHTLDLFSVDWYATHRLRRFDIAYVAESHGGDRLNFYQETADNLTFNIRITKGGGDNETEVVRCCMQFSALDDASEQAEVDASV